MKKQHSVLLAFLLISLPALAAGDGWNVGVDVTLEGATSLRGGAARGSALHSLALGHLAWEQGKTAADGGVRFRGCASVLALTGRGPTERFLGDFLAASNIEGYASTRLYATWMEAIAGDWSLRAGALLADEEFAGTTAGGNFFNSVFGWPAFISANTVNTGPAFFAAAPGLRLERRFGEKAAWRIGVYDGDTFDSSAGDPHVNRHGWHYRLGGEQGWFLISEATHAPGEGATRWKAGGWLHTAGFDDVSRDASGRSFAVTGAAARRHPRNFGGYAVVEQTLAGTPGKAGNVEVFLRGGVAPADRNALAWTADSGVAWSGPLPGRPADVVALGVAHAAFGSPFSTHARAIGSGAPAPDSERVIEISYRFVVSERLSLVPDVQLIRHPGGSRALRDAVVGFLRLNASL